jgi:alpha-amylase/alpha-mannosidase (GH57 family)
MSAKAPLKVVLCWHMHQPNYQDPLSGEYRLPWTYLHAIKDYVDMAAHLEAVPGARAVVNFVPILLEQIADYADQVRRHLQHGDPLRDPVLAALVSPPPDRDGRSRSLIRACLRANEENLIDRWPAYRRLADLANWVDSHPESLMYLDDQFLADLATWYHLAWMGETVRRQDSRIQRLQDKGVGFSHADRRELLTVIGEILEDLLPRYRRLAEQGQVELSTTPYAHPISPLLLDFHTAREAMPEIPLPENGPYPGGEERAGWHLDKGAAVFEEHFGFPPQGVWPAEGGVSEGALDQMAAAGYRWAATGEGVLGHSLGEAYGKYGPDPAVNLAHPYRVGSQGMPCFFRDDELSDLIGFNYSDWHADDAVANLVHRLEGIAAMLPNSEEAVVPIVLDGENAWEHYPANGFHFLRGLYEHLADHPTLELTTFGEALDAGCRVNALDNMVAGSWVYGTFSTWIGDADKNRAWELLVEGKQAFDEEVAAGRLAGQDRAEAEHQLAICEGSDWFWWFGDYNPADTVRDFDRLYRLQLGVLYRRLGRDLPDHLSHVLSHGSGAPEQGGVMRRSS